jgi:hypothetical protein
MTSSSLASMYIQFRTLTFHSRMEEQLQECLCLKKFATSFSAVIGALDSPLVPHLESDPATNLYSGSTLIDNMHKSNRRININLLNKSVITLSTVIGASGSPLGPCPKRDLVTDLYSVSIPIAIKDKSNRQIRFR